MTRPYVGAMESLAYARLDPPDREELLESQVECTFVFEDERGWPSGVVMNYLRRDGVFWLTAVEGRAHVRALAREPRVSIVVSSAGSPLSGRRMLAYRGLATIHHDVSDVGEVLDAMAARFRPGDPKGFRRLLDSPNRVVIEVTPIALATSHDHRKVAAALAGHDSTRTDRQGEAEQ
ncbi:pyridoxamine 5'-phosphate oxidase family protein [Sphaerimonospora sp. CA-214678]|uniref:pyridoxamine 5'-phosphate oxidase family protein n=1 Tax=Sphaerimonospora sp. CA-214678 TaxID=3240029 RepID=UPI003D90B1D5